MLVYRYSHLRETCRMGHTRIKDIDVSSFQSLYGQSRRGSDNGVVVWDGLDICEKQKVVEVLYEWLLMKWVMMLVVVQVALLSGNNGGGDKRDYDLIGVNNASREYEQR